MSFREMMASVVFYFASAVIAYIIAVYPLFLFLVRWRKAPAIAKDMAYRPSVSAIVAVHNGAAYLKAKIETLLALDYPKRLLEIIVVSDGSTDETAAIAALYADRGVFLIEAPRAGKAAALNRAIAHASGEILFFTDVRQPLDPQSLGHLAANFADASVGACTGEMVLVKGDSGEQADMDLYWRYEIRARRIHSAIDSTFTVTGCIYALRRSLARAIPVDSLTDDATLSLRAFVEGYRVIFDSAAIAFDYPALPGTEFRRRFRTLAGLWQVHARLPWLFGAGNRMRFHFLSHKFSRLVLPWAILLFVGSSLLLPHGPVRSFVWTGEGAFLVVSLLNRLVPNGWAVKRITSPAQTFLTMNVAAMASVAVFLVPAERLWRPTEVQKASKGL